MTFSSQALLCANCGYPSIEKYPSYPSPSLQTLHSSNVSPIDHHDQKIVLDIQSDLSRINSEIARTQTLLDHLASEQQRLTASLILYQSLIAPIRRLPTEVLAEIFKTLPRRAYEATRVSKSPLLLTRICSRWRDVAISTPQLWDTISFKVFDAPSYVRPISTENLGTWLSRSGACPLTIRANFLPIQTSINFFLPFIDMLASCSYRWHHFNIVAPFSLDQFTTVKGSLPILRTLTIDSYNSPILTQLDAFKVAPNLRKLYIMSASVIPTKCCVPWARLGSLRGPETSINECLAILKLCPELTWCSLHCDSTRTSNIDTPASPIEQSKLQWLRIHTDDNELCSCIFESFACPALYYLHIQSTSLSTPLHIPSRHHLSSFLPRSSCILQTLSLHHICLDQPELAEFLEQLPSLTELDLHESPNLIPFPERPLLDRMTFKDQPAMGAESALLVPNLKVLKLNMLSPREEILLAMIQSRWNLMEGTPENAVIQNATRLKSVYLTFFQIDDHFARMRVLRDEGLDIRVVVGDVRYV